VSSAIHPSALVSPEAELDDVEIGPFAVIGGGVQLAPGVRVGSHTVIEGPTTVGARTTIGPHAVIGAAPQDLAHDPGVPTTLAIGPDNVIRSHVTMHRGSSRGRGRTRIGASGLFMVGSHVGHDADVGDGVVLANGVALGGHVYVEERAFLGGLAVVHQNVRVGQLAMVAGAAVCTQDVPPFSLVKGDRARWFGMNRVGLTRAGIPPHVQEALKQAYRLLHQGRGTREERLTELEAHPQPLVAEIVAFARASRRGLCRPQVPA